MTIANHYVIKDILKVWDKSEELKNEFAKFSKRYPDDTEFQEIYTEFKAKGADLAKIKKKLEELYELRAVEASGGPDNLPMSDRRHFSDD